jgi:hypothetical protein
VSAQFEHSSYPRGLTLSPSLYWASQHLPPPRRHLTLPQSHTGLPGYRPLCPPPVLSLPQPRRVPHHCVSQEQHPFTHSRNFLCLSIFLWCCGMEPKFLHMHSTTELHPQPKISYNHTWRFLEPAMCSWLSLSLCLIRIRIGHFQDFGPNCFYVNKKKITPRTSVMAYGNYQSFQVS